LVGQTISHYKILEKLGEGGMGVVYKAEDTKLERIVAIKFFPHHIAANAEERERFKIEAKAAAALNHPNIATIYAIDEVDDEMFIVMEFVDGKELRDLIADNFTKLEKFSKVLEIAMQIAEGLKAAHAKGVTHRDIKSSNIMVTESGQVKIMDFGLAKMSGDMHLTKAGMTLGTAAYMSPEQARGENVDQRTDIWAFGVVLYEMLTGQLPFRGEYEAAMMYSILNEEPKYSDDLPPTLKSVLLKALAKDPSKRYHDTTALLSDLGSAEDRKRVVQVNTATKYSVARRKVYQYAAGIILAIFLTVGAFLWWPVDESQSINSIAVLPLDNLSGDPAQDYFADGMTEALITDLSKIHALKVISRTSVMQFKNVNKTLPQIASELSVDAIIVGSVLTDGDQVRISAQLVEAETDKNLWSESYDRNMTNILALQREIAFAVVDQIKVVLSPEERQRIEKRSTENTEAYQLYLQGRYHWNKRSEEGVNKSIDYFQQAIEKDSTYALAYAGLGDSYLMLGVYGRQRPGESFPLAKTYVNRALRLDSGLAEAYATLGDINIHFDWDLDAAEANLRRAIELNPQYASGFHWYSEVFVLRGEFERAYQESRRALELDPYSLIINTQLGQHYRRAGEFQKAIDQLRKTIEFDSTFAYGHYDLGTVYVALKQFDRAVNNLRKANALAPSDTSILAGLAFAEGFARNKDEAQRIEKALLERAAREYVPPYDLAIVSLGLGKTERALEYLEQAYDEHAPWMPFLSFDPLFSTLSGHPRFRVLLKKVGLPQ